ncbi:MAG: diacylglycerol/lipid kinase family protein [Bacteroidia bacterium]
MIVAKPYIHFIVNPAAGSGDHNITEEFISTFFPSHKIIVEYTQHKGHAHELTNKALLGKPECVVACGGDGTVNEVASCLLYTETALGIVPLASGNGLASHLKIPRQMDKSLQIISSGKTLKIDSGKVNDIYFFSNMGISLDALIIKKYEKSMKKGLYSYIIASFKAGLVYRPFETFINVDRLKTVTKPLLLFISNSNEMGYGISLTPRACLTDGKLNVLIIEEISLFEKLRLGLRVLRGKIDAIDKSVAIQGKEIGIEAPEKIFMDAQVDGEYYYLRTNKVFVKVLPGSLAVRIGGE